MKFKKVTEDYLDQCKYDINKMNLVEKVDNWIRREPFDVELSMLLSILECESPIEQLFAIALELSGLTQFNKFNPKIDVLTIENQKTIQTKNKNYRSDFYVAVSYKKGKVNIKTVNFIIELDGHEFHQKTKEQVERDNQKTRDLQLSGYEVIRFSGSEVYHKPYKCVDTLIEMILSKLDE